MPMQKTPWSLHPYYVERLKNAARNMPDYKAGNPAALFRDIIKNWVKAHPKECRFPEPDDE